MGSSGGRGVLTGGTKKKEARKEETRGEVPTGVRERPKVIALCTG